jgi:ParB-like chromosome segregation protein Spo0J
MGKEVASSLEDLAEDRHLLDIEMVPVDRIDFDPQNPNVMAPHLYEALRREIQEVGFSQPVLLWRCGERFRCIDGEHRVRAVGELGGARVPAVVTEAGDADEARLRLVTMNRFRGAMEPLRFATLIADLRQTVPEAELRRRLAMDESELRDNLRLADLSDDVGEVLREQVAKERREAPVVVRFVLSRRDSEVVERVIALLANERRDRGQALAWLCREHEKAKRASSK